MASLNTKLVLSAVGIALLATTPALAQRRSHRPGRQAYDYLVPRGEAPGVYPNPVGRTGTAEQVQSGIAFGLDRGYSGY